MTYAVPAPMPLPVSDIWARWSGGGDELRPLGTGKFQRKAGLYLPADADEDLSVALDQGGVPRFEVNHRGSGSIDTVHYVGTEFRIYPLIAGIAATRMAGLSVEKKAAMAQAGIGA